MRLGLRILFLVLALVGGEAQAGVIGGNGGDRGGRIGTYVERYNYLRASDEPTIITGLCASACTIILGSVPLDRLCVMGDATLAFHAAWDAGPSGNQITNREATAMLFAMYPAPIQHWITSQGGLTRKMIYLKGAKLRSYIQSCQPATEASRERANAQARWSGHR